MHVDERIGLVLVDRNTVCIAAGDIIVSFCAFPAEAPAAVRFLHPLHNWAIVTFDVADLPLEVRLLRFGLALVSHNSAALATIAHSPVSVPSCSNRATESTSRLRPALCSRFSVRCCPCTSPTFTGTIAVCSSLTRSLEIAVGSRATLQLFCCKHLELARRLHIVFSVISSILYACRPSRSCVLRR